MTDEPVPFTPQDITARAVIAAVRLATVVGIAVALAVTGRPSAALPRLIVWIALFIALSLTYLEFSIRWGRSERSELADRPTRDLLSGWIADNAALGETDRLDLFRQVFYDGRDARPRIARFAILMGFASVIATAGIVADSTAVVIGAMLIAPLITPMMGMALGLVMGWESKLAKATTMVASGMTIAIGVGWLLPSLMNAAVDAQVNTQIVSRTSPTLIDLVVAIAAGAAGAYALARPDVSSSLPGVAIAIALVPPLAVFGLLLNAGEWALARGAGLLFATNLLAILITGGVVFLVTGAAPLARFNDAQHRGRVSLIAIVALALAVVGALAANGAEITRDSLDRDEARTATDEWLGGSELSVISVEVDGDVVRVTLAGAGDPPSAEVLVDELREALGRSVGLDLQWIPRSRITIPSG